MPGKSCVTVLCTNGSCPPTCAPLKTKQRPFFVHETTPIVANPWNLRREIHWCRRFLKTVPFIRLNLAFRLLQSTPFLLDFCLHFLQLCPIISTNSHSRFELKLPAIKWPSRSRSCKSADHSWWFVAVRRILVRVFLPFWRCNPICSCMFAPGSQLRRYPLGVGEPWPACQTWPYEDGCGPPSGSTHQNVAVMQATYRSLPPLGSVPVIFQQAVFVLCWRLR